MRTSSISRRLILTVLLLELLAAAGLVAAVIVHERHVQLQAFDANLRGTANALLGAVQEQDDDNVSLHADAVPLARGSIYSVVDEDRRSLAAVGDVPALDLADGSFRQVQVDGRSYRFFAFAGDRVVDPGKNWGVRHHVRVLYGQPDGHVWHEVFEAVQFVAVATALLLGVTTLLMVWLIRRLLLPIRSLAVEAEKIDAARWHFDAPASARDVEELRPLVSAIDTMMTRLHRSFDQQRRFTSDAAHELKTDLAILKSSLQLLGMRKRTVPEYEQGLAVVLEDSGRLESTIQRMLTLARLEQPARDVAQVCDLGSVLQDALQQVMPFAAVQEVAFQEAVAEGVAVAVDSRDALLLCSNILLNALQHSPLDSVVEVALRTTDSVAEFMVRDRGEGVAEEDRAHVFEPFYRGDASRSRKTGGTGLGLSICKAICERSGGQIAITNDASGGAVVTVQLPLIVG